MLTAGYRLYRILTFQMFILLLTMICIQSSSIGKDRTPNYFRIGDFEYTPVRVIPGQEGEDLKYGDIRQTNLRFRLEYDVSNVYLFTTKQLFLGIVAYWNATDAEGNSYLYQQIVWDLVVLQTDSFGKTLNQTLESKYPLRSIEGLDLQSEVSFYFFVEEISYGGWFRRWRYEMDRKLQIQ